MSDNRRDLNKLSDEAFRLELREWLEKNLPPEYHQDHRRPFLRLRREDHRRWLRMVYDGGWRAPAWPRELGGLDLSFTKQLIYQEEFERAGVARVIDHGVNQLGPIIIGYGTEAQKKKYLPAALKCEHIWAQGYSEPGAGSDLASLRIKADLEGDHFVVNGQKIWTSHANDSTHIFLLVRTGRFEKKQQGISFLLVDSNSPGITIRPIITLAGEDELCEVFFDNVKVPAENLVGKLHEGWTIAKALLGHERIFLGSTAQPAKAMELSAQLVAELKLAGDQGVMDRYAQLVADMHDYRHLYAEICSRVAAGEEIGPEASVLKIYVSELLQRISEFNLDIAGEYGGMVGDVRIGNMIADPHWQFMMTRPVTVFGGTNEIQRDILAQTVLGLRSK